MSPDDLLKALYGVGIAALGLVSLVLGVLARFIPDMIRTYLEGKKLLSLDKAGTLAAQAVEEKSRTGSARWAPDAKQDAARAMVRSIAPAAAKGLDMQQLDDVVKAGVQKMRVSLPTPSNPPPPIDVLRPPKVPREE